MKKSVLILSILLFSITLLFAQTTDDSEDFEILKNNLAEAVEQRNFHDAKLVLAELYPLMKAELKESKKSLHSIKKMDNPAIDPKKLARDIERKAELVETIKQLMDASPAAIRVKSKDLLVMVEEFDDLRLALN
jgi:hypothetical protein